MIADQQRREYDEELYQLRKRADDAELRTLEIHGLLIDAHGRLFALQDAIWDHLTTFWKLDISPEEIRQANEQLWKIWREQTGRAGIKQASASAQKTE